MGELRKFKEGQRVIYNGTWKHGHTTDWRAGDKCVAVGLHDGNNWLIRRVADGVERVFWDKYFDIAPSTAMVLKPKRRLKL